LRPLEGEGRGEVGTFNSRFMERMHLRFRMWVATMNQRERAGTFSPLTPALSPLRGEGDVNSLPLRPLGGEGRGEGGTFNSRFMRGLVCVSAVCGRRRRTCRGRRALDS